MGHFPKFQNLEAVRKILEVDGLQVQLGGGMRDER